MNKINPTIKGIITSAVMIGITAFVSFGLNATQRSDNYTYLIYAVYSAGILWTLFSFKKTGEHNFQFKTFFNQGFKCFIVVTLFMVIYTFIVMKMNVDTESEILRRNLVAEKGKTPSEIEDIVKSFKKNSPTLGAGFAMFQYLLIGALVTGIASGFLSKREEE